MSDNRLLPPEPGMAESSASPPRTGRLQTRVQTLIVLVAFCGGLLWVARHVWESQHSAVAVAHGLRARNSFDRDNAARHLVQLGLGDASVAIPPLIAALNDAEPEVRVAAAEALNPLISDAVAHGTALTEVRAAVTGLCEALRDRETIVRIAAAEALGFIAYSSGASSAIDIDALVASLAAKPSDPEDNVRLDLISAVANCGRHVTVAPPQELVTALKDHSAKNRAAAVTALASFQCRLDPWVPSFLQSLENDEPQVRDACGHALSRDKPPAVSAAALHHLIEALAIRNRFVRFYAARALLPHTHAP
jgi:HEAT repeat protein